MDWLAEDPEYKEYIRKQLKALAIEMAARKYPSMPVV